jgi:hypothetical protein
MRRNAGGADVVSRMKMPKPPRAEPSTEMKKTQAVKRQSPVRDVQAGEGRPVLSVQEFVSIPPPGPAKLSEAAKESDQKTVHFGYFDPDATEVFVAGSFNHWNPRATRLRREWAGEWSVALRLPPGEYSYRFLVDGEWRDDPSAQFIVTNRFGSFDAVVVV